MNKKSREEKGKKKEVVRKKEVVVKNIGKLPSGIKRKRDCGKSKNRHWLMSRYEDAFCDTDNGGDELTRDSSVYIEESLMRFNGYDNHMDEYRTLEAFYDYLMKGINRAMEQPHIQTVVAVFDKPDFVPPNKKLVWDVRDESKKLTTDPYKWDGKSKILDFPMDSEIPDWKSIKANRRAYGQAIFDIICIIKAKFVPPPGKRIIVDGGKGKLAPLMIYTKLDGTTIRSNIDLLRNNIGEGDYSVTYYVNQFSDADVLEKLKDDLMLENTKVKDIIVCSTDTDVLLSLIFHARSRLNASDKTKKGYAFKNNVFIVYGGLNAPLRRSKSNGSPLTQEDLDTQKQKEELKDCYYSGSSEGKKKKQPTRFVLDINHVCMRITEDLKKHTHNPLESFVTACYTMGGDYLDGPWVLTQPVALDCYFDEIDRIKDLICFLDDPTLPPKIEVGSVKKLLASSYSFTYNRDKKIKSSSDEELREKGFVEKKVNIHLLSQASVKGDQASEGRYMDEQDFCNRMLRLSWFMDYVHRTVVNVNKGDSHLEPTKWGYNIILVKGEKETDPLIEVWSCA